MDAIRDEMAKSGDGYTGMLGEMLTEFLRMHPEWERAPEGKTLKSAMDALKAAAKKKAKDSVYAMSSREVFDLMLEHFGLTPTDEDYWRCMAAVLGVEQHTGRVPEAPNPATRTARAVDPFNIDALLGE
jgi:hypothetical protein